jgi:RNA polymerase sigma-B factor
MAVAMSSPVRLERTRREEARLLLRYHRDGDLAARRELVERFMPLARSLASRYSHTEEPLEDLVQVACLALIKAIDRFDPTRGSKFTSFAAPTILGELKRHFRDKGWALHVTRDLQERTLLIGRETEALSKELGRSPTVREVAAAAGCTVEETLEAREVSRSAYDAGSLDEPVGGDDGDAGSLMELLGQEDDAYDLVDSREAIARTWSTLPELDRHVLELRLVHDLTQREIGARVGYSQMHVSRVLRRSLDRLERATAA